MRQELGRGPAKASGRPVDANAVGSAARTGLLGGVVASIPVLGPLLGAVCASCVGLGGAAAAGAAAAWGTPVTWGATVVFLTAAGWFTLRRARRRCSAEECRVLARRLPLLLGAAAAATYLLSAFVVAPLLRKALEELSRAFNHLPS